MQQEIELAKASFDFGFLLSPIAIIFSAITAGTIAINLSQRQKSVELLQNIKSDKRIDSGLATLRKIHNDSGIEIECYAYAERADSKEAVRIRYILNTFEQMASGISDSVYDENIIKRSKYTTVINTYKRSKKFIDKVQESQPTAYQELTSLAKRWESKPLKKRGKVESLLRALKII
ncbi:DUF4760 domain-containing protein [Thiomicrorhabdus sp.]|uniref:DUF4760 domain-containing protein n=1 Tax=Thiomicrorhabdus sp. TaxID=2039724 RepID=UPI0029C824A3|nr:DUF4760 domain-containing protein [Thiomicrorhabdus sp.]